MYGLCRTGALCCLQLSAISLTSHLEEKPLVVGAAKDEGGL